MTVPQQQMVPALFSVSYAGLWGQASLGLEDFIRKAGELGYPVVELMGKHPHLSVLDLSDERLASVRNAASEAGVEIATVAGYTDFTAGKTAHEEAWLRYGNSSGPSLRRERPNASVRARLGFRAA